MLGSWRFRRALERRLAAKLSRDSLTSLGFQLSKWAGAGVRHNSGDSLALVEVRIAEYFVLATDRGRRWGVIAGLALGVLAVSVIVLLTTVIVGFTG
jgi:hypothetical protein